MRLKLEEKNDLKKEMEIIEALLFTSVSGMTINEIKERTGINKSIINKCLKKLKEKHKGGFVVTCINDKWLMRINNAYVSAVKDLAKREFSKALLGTLAVIAYKNPILQSDVIKIRGNKAYDHIDHLCNIGFVVSKPHGRTRQLRLGKKFYEYFEIRKGDEKKIFNKK